ncbi:Zinc finger, CCHC-type [Sesbania bispinosa]|nr:Zinc finger, CCHC-type [Sesbania bispinosa]
MDIQESVSEENSPIEGAEIQLDIEGESGLTIARKTLVGRILTDKSLNRVAVKEILAKAWGLVEDINISDLGPNIFLFHFSEEKQAKKVLEEGPRFVMGQLLHGLPLDYMNTKNATKIAGFIGEVVLVENPFVNGHLLRSFMRIRVRINVKKPLITGFWLPRKDLPKTWIFIKYERLQGFCYNCGVIGHDNRTCKKGNEMAVYNISRPRFGPSLGVPQPKSLAAIVTENIRRKNKNRETEEAGVPKETYHKDTISADNNGQKVTHIGAEVVETGSVTKNQGRQLSPCRRDSGTAVSDMGPTRNHPPTTLDSHPQKTNIEVTQTSLQMSMGPDQIQGAPRPTTQIEETFLQPNPPILDPLQTDPSSAPKSMGPAIIALPFLMEKS